MIIIIIIIIIMMMMTMMTIPSVLWLSEKLQRRWSDFGLLGVRALLAGR